MKRIAAILVFLISTGSYYIASAEEQSPKVNKIDMYEKKNPNSIAPIPDLEILFRYRVWREMYLKEKPNKPFFANGKEITKAIIDGVREGKLTPYENETFAQELTQEEFFKKLELPELTAEAAHSSFTDSDGAWGNKGEKATPKKKEAALFAPKEVSTLEIVEDYIFDKIRAVIVYDIQAIKLVVPAEKFETGLSRAVATFKYKDLAAYFDTLPEDTSWINVGNNIGNLKFTDAFKQRLFSSRIIKIENPDNSNLEDIYNKDPKSGVLASIDAERKLLEKESAFWEY